MPRSQPCRKTPKLQRQTSSMKHFLSSRKTRVHPPRIQRNLEDPCFPRDLHFQDNLREQKDWAEYNTLLPQPTPLLQSFQKQLATSRLNHSFSDQPYRRPDPMSSQSPEQFYSPMASIPTSTQQSFPKETLPISAAVMNTLPMDILTSKGSSDSSPARPLSPASSFCPDPYRLYIASLPETLQELSHTARKTGLGKRRATSPPSHIPSTASQSQESMTLPKYPRVSRSKDVCTQTSPMEPAPTTSLSQDQRNTTISCPSHVMQQLIESDLARPRCCLCGATQDWERLRHFKQSVVDLISDTIPNAQVIDGLTAMTANQSYSSMSSRTAASLVVNGTHFVIPVHQFWRLRALSSLISAPTTSYWRIGGRKNSINGLRLKCLPSGQLTVAD